MRWSLSQALRRNDVPKQLIAFISTFFCAYTHRCFYEIVNTKDFWVSPDKHIVITNFMHTTILSRNVPYRPIAELDMHDVILTHEYSIHKGFLVKNGVRLCHVPHSYWNAFMYNDLLFYTLDYKLQCFDPVPCNTHVLHKYESDTCFGVLHSGPFAFVRVAEMLDVWDLRYFSRVAQITGIYVQANDSWIFTSCKNDGRCVFRVFCAKTFRLMKTASLQHAALIGLIHEDLLVFSTYGNGYGVFDIWNNKVIFTTDTHLYVLNDGVLAQKDDRRIRFFK